MNGIKVDIINKKIIVNKTFYKKMSNITSDEYEAYERVRALHPKFKFEVKKQKTYDHDKNKISYRLIVSYIYCHEPDEEIRNKMYAELREEKWKALGHTCGFHEVRAWFLSKYPDYDYMYFKKNPEPPKTIIDKILQDCDIHSGGTLLKNKDVLDLVGDECENLRGMAEAA